MQKILKTILPWTVVSIAAIILILVVLSVYLSEPSQKEHELHYSFFEITFKSGDDARWADPKWDDSSWIKDSPMTPLSPLIKITEDIYWLRYKITIESDTYPLRAKMLLIALNGAYELYWDGHLLISNGQPSSIAEDEQPGQLINSAVIPNSLYTLGEPHHLTLRISSHYRGPHAPLYPTISFHDYETQFSHYQLGLMKQTLPHGTLLIIALFYLLLYIFYERKVAFLLFSLLCLSESLPFWNDWLRLFYRYTYDWYSFSIWASTLNYYILSLLLPAFLLQRFEFSHKFRWSALLLGMVVISWFLDPFPINRALYMLGGSVIISSVISIWALFKKSQGSVLGMIGMSCYTLVYIENAVNREEKIIPYTFGFVALILCLLASLTWQMRQERRSREKIIQNNAQLEANKSRLKAELLKSKIQPHFLMNTLTSLMEWFETDPQVGSKFVDALAREYRILSEVADQTLIPISKEIEICRSFMEIMSFQQKTQYKLDVSGFDETDEIPPLLFHTLIENGITHNVHSSDFTTFYLKKEDIEDGNRCTLIVPLQNEAQGENTKCEPDKIGTGLAYVKARLEESFPGNWDFQHGPCEEGWKTIITIT